MVLGMVVLSGNGIVASVSCNLYFATVIGNSKNVRAPKRPKEQLRAAILAAGHELLAQRGLEGGATSVPLHAAIERAAERLGERITPASVYGRIWESQAEFQLHVLLEAAKGYPAGEEEPTANAAAKVLAQCDTTTLTGRRASLHEIWRTAGAVHVEVLKSSRSWQLWVGVWALTVSTPTTDDDAILGPALRQGDESATAALRDILDHVSSSLGFHAKFPNSMDDFAVAVSCLAEGFALRERFGANGQAVHHADADVESPPWVPFAVALRAMADAYLEPIARWKPPV